MPSAQLHVWTHAPGCACLSRIANWLPSQLHPLVAALPQNPDSCALPPGVPSFQNVTQAVRGGCASPPHGYTQQ